MIKLFFLAVPLLASGLVVGNLAQVATKNNDSAGAVQTRSTTVSFKSVYEFNETLEIPILEKDGQVYSSSLIKPDGSATKATSVLLDQVGTYKVVYTLMFDGVTPLKQEFTFIVKNQYFMFSGPKSFAKYEKSDRTYNVEGLFVSLANGEYLTFNKNIDMNGAKKATPYLEWFAAPSDVGKTDFMELDCILTDVEDPSRTLKTRMKGSQEGLNAPYTYIDVGGNGQDYVGIERTKIHTNSQFGCPVHHSFYGFYPTGEKCGSHIISISFDEGEMATYANSGLTLVADHDSSQFYTSLWDGFTSGICSIKLQGQTFTGDYANFVLKSIKDLDLSKRVVEDSTGPQITIDCPYDEANMPNASVGEKYKVFDASALDNLSGDCPVSVSAYYYKNTRNYSLTIEDGYFNVDLEGEYRLVYTAKDKVGNTSTKTLKIKTSSTIEPITLLPKSALPDTIKQGNIYSLPKFKISGGSGNYDQYYSVTLNGYPVDIENNSFRAEEIGVYKIVFTAVDVRGVSQSYSYSVASIYNEDPVFVDEPELQKYLLSGYWNKIPKLYAVDYSNGRKQILADVEIDYNGSKTTILSGEKYKPEVANHLDTIKITYKVRNTTKSYTLPCAKVFNGIYLDLAGYFVGDNFQIDLNHDGKSRVVPKEAGNATLEFINPLPVGNASVVLGFEAGRTTYSGFDITFTDKLDSTKSVTMRIQQDASNNVIALVDGTYIKTDIPFTGSDSFTVSCTATGVALNKSEVVINHFDDGSTFTGFDSNMIYFTLTMLDAKVDSAFFIHQICNQNITSIKADRSEPIITVLDNYGGYGSLGSYQETVRVFSCDVLDPSSDVTVTVTTPSREIAKDVYGNEIFSYDASERYGFFTNEYGQFNVNFLALDSRENEATFAYSIGVLDDEAPEIIITSSYDTTVAVGGTLIVPTYTVKDNVDENPKSYINIISPNGIYYILTGKTNSLKVKFAGVYRVEIVAIDSAGNMGRFSYTVTAK